MAATNAFEEERQSRIARNAVVMESLDLPGSVLLAKRKPKQERQKRKLLVAAAEPTRRSRRQQGAVPDTKPLGQEWREQSSNVARRLPPRPASAENTAEYVAALHQYNLHRLGTMSDAALSTRIRRITNIDKMRSFVEVLEADDKDELAAEAKAALQKLLENIDN